MQSFNLQAATYCVSGLRGFSLNEALRYWKAKFETFKHFRRDVITHPLLEELGEFVSEIWDDIQPITVQDALGQTNLETRRVMFDCIGVSRLFKQLEPELLDRQVLCKKRTRWDDKNKSYLHEFEDVYELYRLEGAKLFTTETSSNRFNPVYAVRCWCTTTGREYWIYVPEDIALGAPSWFREKHCPDAIRAIAWTIRIDISHPKRIFRQGDIIVAQESRTSVKVPPYHLGKEDYIQLIFSET